MTSALPVAKSSQTTVTLTAGRIEVCLHPALGARIGRLALHQADGTVFDCLVPLTNISFCPALWPKEGCFPMLPFTNKFAGNAFSWCGNQVRVSDENASGFLHGWGLRQAWAVDSLSGTHCTMSLDMVATEQWPWDYEARIGVTVDESGVNLVMSVINCSAEPMPAGLGFHPYFPIHGGIAATVNAAARWRPASYSDGLPVFREPLSKPIRFDLEHGGLPDTISTWFCENGGSYAELLYAAEGRRIVISSHDAGYVVVHSPATGRYLCIEPSTHLAGQLNADTCVAMPGEAASLSMRMQLE